MKTETEQVAEAVQQLLQARIEMDKRYRAKCEELNAAIGRMLNALRKTLRVQLKDLAGQGFLVMSTLSGLFHGQQPWTPEKARIVLEKLRALEQQQQQKAPRP